MRKSQQIGRIILDILCIVFVFLPWTFIHFLADPYQRGFFCDDESISHPYKESTITSEVLAAVGVLVPVLAILITEGVHFANHRTCSSPDPAYVIGHVQIPFVVYQYYKLIGIFLFGAAFQQSIVNIGKYSVGRLRPHFFDVCKPNYTQFNCTDVHGYMIYVQGDYCTGTDQDKLLDMRLSFPSGHASFSAYSMVFAALYLHGRFTWKGSRLLCPLLQCIAIMMALYCSLSRISDYKHHWSDVLLGAIFGTLVACVSLIHYGDVFKKEHRHELSDCGSSELEHVKATRPISRITYLNDDVVPPVDYGPSCVSHRNNNSVQP